MTNNTLRLFKDLLLSFCFFVIIRMNVRLTDPFLVILIQDVHNWSTLVNTEKKVDQLVLQMLPDAFFYYLINKCDLTCAKTVYFYYA